MLHLFRDLYGSNLGPRSSDVLLHALVTLARSDRGTLADLPVLLTNAAFRRRQLAAVSDPLVLAPFFAWYDIGGIRAGSSGYIYGLTGLGQAVIEVGGPLGRRRRRIWETKPYFQDHLLAVAELYVQLVEQHRVGQSELLAFDAEPGCWRHFTGPGGELVVVKPDAYVLLGTEVLERSAFIEVDLATEGLPTIRRKCLRFIAYWQSGMEQRWRGVFPKVVWLVQDERRQERIAEVIGKLAVDTQALFEVGLLSTGPQLLIGSTQGVAS